jgi:hypothetical protein
MHIIASFHSGHSDIFHSPRKHRVTLEALRIQSYLYALPTVQERVLFDVECARIEKIVQMEKYLEDLEKIIQGKQ